jgi:hypothetical protein
MGKKQTERGEKSGNIQRRSPRALWLGLKGIEADPTPVVNVGMEDGRQETDLGGFKRVAGRDFEFETEEPGSVGGAFGALDT